MSLLSLSNYCTFLNTHLEIQHFLIENHLKMQDLLKTMATEPWAKKTAMDAYVYKLANTLKGVQNLIQKEWEYWQKHRTCLQSLDPSELRVGYSHYCLMLNGQDQIHTFLEQNYLRIHIFLAMIASQDVLPEPSETKGGIDIFSKYLSINQALNIKVLKEVRKTIAFFEALSFQESIAIDMLGSEQLQNLIAYCNRWGMEGT